MDKRFPVDNDNVIHTDLKLTEIEAKSLLRKYKKTDSWFISRYAANIYRGCSHACAYCDGRYEKYNVQADFDKNICVKTNSPELLRKELTQKGKRKPLRKEFIIIGGGVGDAYQPAEKKYETTRKVLSVISEYNFPVHILTKSPLVWRDADIISKINKKSRAIVSFSFSTVKENIAKIFEKDTPSPVKRLKTMEKFSKIGIPTGAFLMPVIPFVSDTSDEIDKTLLSIKTAGAKFVLFGGLTLKTGRQKDFFMQKLKKSYPTLIHEYDIIYPGRKYGNATDEYYISIHETFLHSIKKHKIPLRVPVELFNNILHINTLVCVILEHVDYLLKLKGKKSPYSYAAYSVSKLKTPVTEMTDAEIKALSGVGPVTYKFIKEIVESRRLNYLDYLTNEIFRMKPHT